MTSLEKLLAEVRELDEKAVKGPWDINHQKGLGNWRHRLYESPPGAIYSEAENHEASDEQLAATDLLVARYRTLAPKLAEIVELFERVTCKVSGPHLARLSSHVLVELELLASKAFDRAEEIAGRE